MGSARCVRCNDQEVVAKIIDGEAILINLVTGVYYSMDNTGAAIWSLIEGGQPVDQIAASVTSTFDVSPDRATADIESLLRDLLDHRLIVESDAAAAAVPEVVSRSAKLPYVSPVLNVYTDMGDLLALDPPVPGFEDISWEK